MKLYAPTILFPDTFDVYVTHSFDFNGVIDEAQDDIGDSDKDDDTNELTLLLKGVEIYQILYVGEIRFSDLQEQGSFDLQFIRNFNSYYRFPKIEQ